jgi:rhamnogalacturonan endolyase
MIYHMTTSRMALIVAGLTAMAFAGPVAAQKPVQTPVQIGGRQFEHLDRGVVAVPALGGGNLVSWRLLGTDPAKTAFNIYRDGKKLNTAPISATTNYGDKAGVAGSTYVVRAVVGETERAASKVAAVWQPGYLSIPIQKPQDGTTPAGDPYTYKASDVSAADLDGDGQLELVLKWDPSNAQDNSRSGYTGNVFIDAYTFEGKRLWRIDLGKNIRAGQHYTQFLVYDFDGDGKAEMSVKTADGTIDGQGKVIGDPNADWRSKGGELPAQDKAGAKALSDGKLVAELAGRVLQGPEYLTVFDGLTGGALATAPYDPPRYPGGNPTTEQLIETWGDGYGNRVDRFLAGVAYLDGKRPSIVYGRGYYTKSTLAAWDYRDGKLTKRWFFDSEVQADPDTWRKQGNHSLSVADIDGDGKDEIIYGSMAIDDDGTGLWSTGLKHGDALHVSDFDPVRPGLERFGVHENSKENGGIVTSMVDAKTGNLLWTVPGTIDNGRGIIMDVDPRYPGAESWTSAEPFLRDVKGNPIGATKPQTNKFAVWWDGDLQREQYENMNIYKWNWKEQRSERLLNLEGTSVPNAPSLSGDVVGDWREEVVVPATDSQSLRIYATPYVTTHKFVTLMHDPVYRLAIAWQQTTYNQPPHTSFYLGE